MGKKVSLSDYRGQAVLLNFWYIDCPGCKVELPGIQKVYAAQQAARKDFVVLGINVVDDQQTLIQFMRQKGLTYPVLLDQHMTVDTLYNVNGTPTSYFLDRAGVIRQVQVGPIEESDLQQIANRLSA